VPHALVGIVTWAVLSSLINEALPTALAEAPYHLSPQFIGVSVSQVRRSRQGCTPCWHWQWLYQAAACMV